MQYKRLWFLAALVVVFGGLTLLAPTTFAAVEGNYATKIVKGDVEFTIPADACSLLPAGLEVSGTGKRFQVLSTKLKKNGSTLEISNDFIDGTATDNNGGTYNFVYTNQAQHVFPKGGGAVQVNMTDTFILDNTNGTNDYTVAFHWKWTYTPPAGEWPPNDNWDQMWTIGDPLTCDPL
jgi:hypothetical protein